MAPKSVKILLVLLVLAAACKGKTDTQQVQTQASKADLSNLIYGEGKKAPYETFRDDLELLINQQNYDELAYKLENASKDYPEKAEELAFYAGVYQFSKNNLAKAAEEFKKSEKALPGETSLYFGHIERRKRNFSGALARYQKAYELTRNPEVLSSLGDLYYENRKNKEAQGYYERAIAEKPDAFTDRYLLANILFQQGKSAESEKLLNEAIEINPRFKKAYVGLYAIYAKRKNNTEALYYQCRILLLDQKYDGIIKLLEKESATFKDLRLVKFYIVSRIRAGDMQAVKTVLTKASAAFPDDADIKMYQGMVLVIEKETKQAVKYFRDLYGRVPGNFNIAVAYADALMDDKQEEEALHVYERALLLEHSNTQYRYKLAEIYRKKNELDKELFHRGLQFYYQLQSPEAFEALVRVKKPLYEDIYYYYLGKIYMERSNLDEAVKAFKTAIDKNSRMTRAYLELSYALMRKKERLEALRVLETCPEKTADVQKLLTFIKNFKD